MAPKQTKHDTTPAPTNAWMITTFIFAGLLILSLVWSGILTMMLVQGGGGTLAGGSAPTKVQAPPPSPTPAPPSGGVVAVEADDDPVLGNPDAPVTIIEFSDYECPFCGRFYSDSLGQIKTDYVDKGLVKVVYRDYPLSFHPRAMPAAIAAECIDELSDDETYFEFHDLLFKNQGAQSDADFAKYAEQVGVNSGDFADCYADADGTMEAEVQADFQAGQAAGVTGTPTVFVNGNKIVGAQPYSVFKAAIDAELN